MRNHLARVGRQFLSSLTRRKSAGRRPAAAPKLDAELLESRDLLTTMSPTYLLFHHTGGIRPLSTAGPTGTSPSQVRHAYGFDQITFNGGTVAGDGSGTTIAIVDAYDDPNIASDLHQFDQRFGLSDPTFTKVNEYGGTNMPSPNGGWIGEIALDVEWAHLVAPKAGILLVEANSNSSSDLFQAVRYAAGAPGVVAVSMSWAGSEWGGETGTDAGTFVTPAGHAGVTFVASSGDSGAPALYPSASPNVLSVGGTTLHVDGSGNITSESAWSGGGGGISTVEAQPSYQKGVVTQTSTRRATPDVSYDANPSTGFPVYDSYNNGTASPWVQYGGTSDAAPQWAALIAIADQQRALAGFGPLDGPSQTLPALYQLPPSDFHDITSGGSTGSPPYSAGPGYDLATGRGSPAANLVVAGLASYGTTGPHVTAVDVSGTGRGSVGAVTLTFNEAIQDGTFTLASVDSLTGPAGAVTPTAVNKLSGTQYQVIFPPQSAPGTYTLVVGPNMKDTFGNRMDQNQNGVNGEDPADRFTDTFTIGNAPVPTQFEFGTATSPVAAGYTPVTETTGYGAFAGYGWQSGGIDSRDRGTGSALTSSFDFTRDGTFAVDLANGTYNVTVTLGDALYAQGAMGISLQGTQVDSVTTAAGQFATKTYAVAVSNGQLDLRLVGLGGTSPFACIDALVVTKLTPPLAEFKYGTATSAVPAGYTAVTEATAYSAARGYGWQSGSIDSRDRGTANALTSSFDFTRDGTFAVDLANGTYSVTVTLGDAWYAQGAMGISLQGTRVDSVTTAAGQFYTKTYLVTVSNGQLDLRLVGLGGASPFACIDALTVTATRPLVAQFHFGTATSPVAPGYSAVTEATAYSAARGYGWQSGSIDSRDRGTGSALTSAFDFTRDGTFAVDLANGTYSVTVTFGDASYAQGAMGISLQGTQVDSVTTAAGQFYTKTYLVTVSNGQLDLRLVGLGGASPFACIDALTISTVGG